MIGTWFDPLQPSGARLTCAVSGMSDASSGPSAFSRASTSRANPSFASSHCLVLLALGPPPHTRAQERQEAHGPEGPVELEQLPVDLDGLLQLSRFVGPPDARPQDGVLARRDRRGRIDLDVAQLLGDLDDIARSLGIEQLRPHDDASRLIPRELMHRCPRSAPVGLEPAQPHFGDRRI